MRNPDQKREMIIALKRQQGALPDRSMFGGNNKRKYERMIKIIENDETDTDALFDELENQMEFSEAAEIVEAAEWLNGDKEADDLVDDEHLKGLGELEPD